jgi:hypothetical protein
MPVHQNSKIAAWRRREAKRLRRDRKIDAFLRMQVSVAETMHRAAGERIEWLTVYTGKPQQGTAKPLSPFPVTKQANGKRMPRWEDLSQWMKVQVIPMVIKDEFLTFNIRIHPDLERQWVTEGRNIRSVMRDRLRGELDVAVGKGREFFFVIQGWSKKTRSPTYLHIHGGAALRDHGDDVGIELAAGRAAGHGLKGYSKVDRAVHSEPFKVEQAAYANYLFKAARKPDDRLLERRLTMSNSLTALARSFWETITRDLHDWREPYTEVDDEEL